MHSNSTEEFRDYMRSQGFELPADIPGDGKIRRCHDRRDKRGEKNVWYFFVDGDLPCGMCGYWRTGERHHWSAKRATRMTREEWRTFRSKIKADEQRRRLEENAKHDAAAAHAVTIWNGARDADAVHPYLLKKGIEPFGAKQGTWHNDYIDEDGCLHERVVRDALLVPLFRENGELRSIQAIFPNDDNALHRGKDFLSGGEIQGCRYPIGEITSVNGVPVILVCEGFATGASVHKATGLAVRVAFNAGNLKAVALSVRASVVNAAIVIVADDDQWTTTPIINPGLTKAREAAAAIHGSVATPKFKYLEGRPTDFNDLYKKEGEKAVMEQIMSVVTNAVQGGAESPELKATATSTPPPAFSEDALALEFADRHLDDFRHVKELGCWYAFNDGVWQEDKTNATLNGARSVCRCAATDPSASSLSEGQIRALASSKTATAILKLASADRRLALTAERFDCDLLALNTPAGVVDLRTGEMRPVRPSDYMTKITAIGPDATCPTPIWDEFMKRVTADDGNLVVFLQRLLGYCLTGLTREQVLAFIYGKGANGKSVFMNTVFGIMGNYHKPAAMETFTESKSDRHPTELAALQNARVVSAAETEEGRHLAEAKVKLLTGGEKVPARKMRQDFYEYTPQFKLIFAGNHKPLLRSVDESIQRRFLMVPFTVTIPPEQRDKDLQEKLKAEWPGILAWMIQGCLEWQRIGLRPPESVVVATRDYMEEEDAISAWIDDRCLRNADGWTSSRTLYRSWKEWAEDAGEFVVAEKRFVEQLVAHGFKRYRRPEGRGFIGLSLVNRSSYGVYNSNDGYDA